MVGKLKCKIYKNGKESHVFVTFYNDGMLECECKKYKYHYEDKIFKPKVMRLK